MKIGILGANGFLGSGLVEVFNDDGYIVIPITRNNYKQYVGDVFDVFINVAGNKRNYWANQYPRKDFKISTSVVYDSLFDFKADQYVFMSSIAAYEEGNHYGFNKILSEEIIKRYSKNYLIFRCCAVIDKNINIGIISDIMNDVPLFVSNDSNIQFITKNAVVSTVKNLVYIGIKNKLFNMGGIGSVKVSDIENIINKRIIYQDTAQKRHYEMDVTELLKLVALKTSYDYVMDVV